MGQKGCSLILGAESPARERTECKGKGEMSLSGLPKPRWVEVTHLSKKPTESLMDQDYKAISVFVILLLPAFRFSLPFPHKENTLAH